MLNLDTRIGIFLVSYFQVAGAGVDVEQAERIFSACDQVQFVLGQMGNHFFVFIRIS